MLTGCPRDRVLWRPASSVGPVTSLEGFDGVVTVRSSRPVHRGSPSSGDSGPYDREAGTDRAVMFSVCPEDAVRATAGSAFAAVVPASGRAGLVKIRSSLAARGAMVGSSAAADR